MRNYNSDFLVINESEEKEPRYAVEVSFDDANTDTVVLTSHDDCAVPDGATVIYSVLQELSGTSQEVDPIKANSTIGDLNFNAADLVQALTTLINTKLYPSPDVLGDGLRHKRVQLSVGFKGLPWTSYEIPSGGTQIIDNISLDNNGVYLFECSDVQRTIRKNICDVKTTNLLYTINSTQTAIAVASTTDFETVFHGTSYSDAPSDTVGYIEFEKETVKWKSKLESEIQVTGTDISFSGSVISSTSTDLSVYADKQQIIVSGTASNNGTFNITGTPTATSITVVETFITESAGGSFTLLADIQFYDCTRGALNTKSIEHIIGANTELDRRTKIKEVIYVELPAVKALYAFLTGIIYPVGGGPTYYFPDHWHLGIAANHISTSAFTGIGDDWWNLNNDDVGVPFNQQYITKVDGKELVERELLLLLGAFMPITSTGELSLKRMTYVGVDSPYHHLLDESNVARISRLNHDYKSVYNKFLFKWNWDAKQKEFTRNEFLVDNESIAVHKDTPIHEVAFKGMHGATYSKARVHMRRDSARDRYIGPPQRITVTCSPEMNKVEIGDIVRLKLISLQDFVDGGSINRSFEVQRVAINWKTGRVTLTLFGSTQRPKPLPTLASTTVIPDANYTSKGVDISTVTNGTDIAGTWVINADSTLYGAGTMGAAEYSTGTVTATNGSKTITGSGTTWNNLNNTNIQIDSVEYKIDTIDSDTQITLLIDYAGSTGSGKTYKLHGTIYYWDGDITLNTGINLFVHDNIRIRYKGEFTINGKIDGKGLGRKGATTGNVGEVGYVGNTKGGGGTSTLGTTYPNNPSFQLVVSSTEVPIVEGENSGLPAIYIEYDGTDVIGLDNIDMRPSSGSAGGDHLIFTSVFVNGGAGADAGAALVLEGRGVSAGASSEINLSGNDGELGDVNGPYSGGYFNGGTGAGGSGGPLVIILDGSFATTSDVYTHFISNLGSSILNSDPFDAVEVFGLSFPGNHQSYYVGYLGESQKSGLYREIPLIDYSTPIIDTPSEANPATAINLSEGVASKQSLNLAAIEISVDPPAGDTSYYASQIYMRETGTDAWVPVTIVVGTEEKVVQVPNYYASYEVKAAPISISGIESATFTEDIITITSVSKGASITTGGHIKAGQTSYDIGTGFFLGDDGGTWKFSVGNSAGNKLLWDGADLLITGTITATAGEIGGWNINSTTIISDNNRVILDSANQRIQVQNAAGTNYIRLSADGVVGVDSVLGTVFNLPTNGSAPTFASGIINSTVFNITSAGILETSSAAGDGGASGQGVRINDTGIKAWAANDATPKVTIDASTGIITAIDAVISGAITVGAGSNVAAGADVTGDNQSVGSGLLFNWNIDVTDSDDKPAGIQGNYGITDRTGIAFGDSNKNFMRLEHTTDNAFGYGFPAIPIDDQQKYRVTIRHKSSGVTANGLYLRMEYTGNPLDQGNTHVGVSGDTMVQTADGAVELAPADGPMPGTSWTEVTYTYTPVALTRYASFTALKWYTGLSHTYDIDSVMIQPIAKTADEIDESATNKWAGESGADVTQSALITGTTITGGGITLNAGGSLKSTGKTVGSGTGIFLGYDSGSYQLDVGDHDNEKYVWFDGTDLLIGKNTKLLGSDAFNNDGVYFSTLFESLDGWATAINGSTSVVDIDTYQGLRINSDNVSGEYALAILQRRFHASGFDWSSSRRFKCWVSFDYIAGAEFYIQSGPIYAATPESAYNRKFGFVLEGTTLYGFAANGSTITKLSLMTGVSEDTTYELIADFTAGTNVNFYVDGTLEGTITTNLPTGAADLGYLLTFESYNRSSTSDSRMYVQYAKFEQAG